MQILNIAFDAKRAFQNFTGLGNYSRTLVETLARLLPHHQYHLYTPRPKQNPRLKNILAFHNIHIHQPTTFFQKKLSALWRIWGINQDLKQDNIQIFHGLSNELPLGIEKTGIKTVVTIHDLIFERYPDFYPFFDTKIYQYKFKSACQRADRIVAISEQTKRDIIDFYQISSEKISVIYQSCHPQFYELRSPEERKQVYQKYQLPSKYLLYVGTINSRKNLLNVTKSLQKIRQTCPDVHLVVVGDGDTYLRKVQEYLTVNNLSPYVHFFPNIDFSDLPVFYQSAAVFVLPSFFEGFGIPIIEALHSRLPVVTSVDSCFAEAGGGHSIYINPNSVEDLSGAILKVLHFTPEERQIMTEYGWQHAQQFKEESLAPKWEKLYNDLLKP